MHTELLICDAAPGRKSPSRRGLWVTRGGTAIAAALLALPLAVAEPTTTSMAAPRTVLMLPVTFTVYQSAVGNLEAVPDWTEAARHNLIDAARDALRAKGGFDVTPMPALSADEQGVLHEHLALTQRILLQSADYRHRPWRARRALFDHSIGDGLRFLHERTGADYALLVDGIQLKQTGGSVFMQLAFGPGATAGGGARLGLSLLDLSDGSVVWFNSLEAIEGPYGFGGRDVRDAGVARAVVTKLIDAYPAIPALSD